MRGWGRVGPGRVRVGFDVVVRQCRSRGRRGSGGCGRRGLPSLWPARSSVCIKFQLFAPFAGDLEPLRPFLRGAARDCGRVKFGERATLGNCG